MHKPSPSRGEGWVGVADAASAGYPFGPTGRCPTSATRFMMRRLV